MSDDTYPNSLDRIQISKSEDKLWCLWIPPSNEQHREDDCDLGPFGNTYFPTFEELLNFLMRVAYPEMIRTGWVPKYLPHKT